MYNVVNKFNYLPLLKYSLSSRENLLALITDDNIFPELFSDPK